MSAPPIPSGSARRPMHGSPASGRSSSASRPTMARWLRVRWRRRPACLVVKRHFRELVVGRVIESVDDIRRYGTTSTPCHSHTGARAWPSWRSAASTWPSGTCSARPVAGPCTTLLGGLRRPSVRAYATGEAFERHRDMGYTAAKFGPAKSEVQGRHTRDRGHRPPGALRIRPDALVMTDCYMSWDFETTVRMADALREFDRTGSRT